MKTAYGWSVLVACSFAAAVFLAGVVLTAMRT